jgi:4-hydroxy-2-oxoglutarate aldolase
MSISGMFPATTTPFAPDGSVSISGVKKNIGLYNQTGLAGYVVLGSTGEAVMLSREEGEAVLIAAKEAAAPGKVLIAGTGAESTAETIARTKRAAALGYEFALVKTPYYYKPFYKPETYIQHYRAVADASPIPVLLYSVPIFTGITLDTPEILTLAEHPNIAGIKDSSSVIQRVSEVVGAAPSRFHLVTGGAAVVYPALVVGAKGAILALASALPEKCVELYELFRTGQHERAKTLQHQLALASKRIIFENGLAGLKFAMELRGYHGGAPRLPMLPLKEEKKQAISAFVAELHPAAASV